MISGHFLYERTAGRMKAWFHGDIRRKIIVGVARYTNQRVSFPEGFLLGVIVTLLI